MTVFYRWLDRVTDGLALIAGLYLAWIFLAIVFQVIATLFLCLAHLTYSLSLNTVFYTSPCLARLGWYG